MFNVLLQIVWVVANVVSSDDIEVYCISVAEAFLYHPSDVPVWQCEFRVDCPGTHATLEVALSSETILNDGGS